MIVDDHSTEAFSSGSHGDYERRATARKGEKPMTVLVPRYMRPTIFMYKDSIMSLAKHDLLKS
jgi:hypothetical protein